MAKAKTQHPPVLLFPTREQLKANRKKLRSFCPLDLRDLLKSAKEQNAKQVNRACLLEFRSRSAEQALALLQALNIDPSDSAAWQKGFFCLATFHYGLGHIAWYPERTNKNAARWTPKDNLLLIKEVKMRQAKGQSERAAIKAIAADAKIKFPYRTQRSGFDRKSTSAEAKEAALWQHLQLLKSRSSWESILQQLVGASRTGLGLLETTLLNLDESHITNQLVKIKSPSGSAR